MSKILKPIILSLLLLCTIGCDFHVPREDVVGTYKVGYAFGVEKLELMDDGRFVQSFTLKGETDPIVVHGTWEYREKSDDFYPEVLLWGSLTVYGPFGKLRDDYRVILEGPGRHWIKSFLGKVTLTINEDLNLKYQKWNIGDPDPKPPI